MTSPEIQAPTTAQKPTELIVPFTYSSSLEHGRIVQPSNLSYLAFDAALELVQDRELLGDQEPHLLIAGEQSYSTHPVTTGELLEREARIQGYTTPVTVLKNPVNRLLNTVLQVEAIADHVREEHPEGVPITTVAWGFHIPRIVSAYRWHGLHDHVVSVEAILDKRLASSDRLQQRFHQWYEFKVEWDELKRRIQREFEFRERYTRPIQAIGRGALLNKISHHQKRGRYDDVTTDGQVIRKRTH